MRGRADRHVVDDGPRVGLIVAAAFVSVIDEAARFRSAHQVEAYLGLVPGEDSSGGRRKIGSITKQGNAYPRSMLLQAAWCVLRSRDVQDPLQLWGKAVAKRRGNRIGAVAVARRLTGVLWAMWRDGTVYDAALVRTHQRPVDSSAPPRASTYGPPR